MGSPGAEEAQVGRKRARPEEKERQGSPRRALHIHVEETKREELKGLGDRLSVVKPKTERHDSGNPHTMTCATGEPRLPNY